MSYSDVEVAIVGGGAAGIAAAHRLQRAAIRFVIIEARSRLGGRGFSVGDATVSDGYGLDLGCGWLHSAERNPWCEVAEAQGATIDKTLPPWMRPPLERGFPRTAQLEFQGVLGRFFERLDGASDAPQDRPAAALLEPDNQWNGLVNAVATYISGAELDVVSAADLDRYQDSGIDWRVPKGFGTVIADHGAALPALRECKVSAIDHGGKRLRLDTADGTITADQAIVTVPSAVLAGEHIRITPALPDKIAAAAGLPLGLADKLFMTLDGAEEFESELRVFGRIDRAATAAYHFRPFGRPLIEAYFGGRFAHELEAQGEAAFFELAVAELSGVFGSAFAPRIKPLRIHCWGRDPLALGSYSYALPGKADDRRILAAPVDQRLFFAGEACSVTDFSTAHGAWHTGIAAADQIIAARSANLAKS